MDKKDEIVDQTETYTVPYSPIYSLPVRMPGITLSVYCTRPHFQLTLKGGCDEEGIFEPNHSLNVWKINSLNYALGRLVYDIVWEDGLQMNELVTINIVYSTIISSNHSTISSITAQTTSTIAASQIIIPTPSTTPTQTTSTTTPQTSSTIAAQITTPT